jgi:hypothetical protein
MRQSEAVRKVTVSVDDIEIVDEKRVYLKISSPTVVESVRALRKAAGLDSRRTAASGTP